MHRKLTFTLTFVLAIAITATAWAGSFSDNDYQGRIEKDKGTFFGFDVKKEHGVTKVKNVEALPKLNCTDGESGQVIFLGKGALRVSSDQTFSGTLPGRAETRGGSAGSSGLLKVHGKLLKHGGARGRVDATFFFAATNPRGGQQVRCYSGDVDWKVKRGAIVNPQPQMRARLR